ncbi:unnamed protein product [Urochloa decumbens]|uniref:ZCF37 n=1 Tax=Urochloa decumbens TaxID=240449 RepID=A0ABC8YCZ9_9POAL
MFCECGTGSFKHVDEDPGCGGGSPSPRGRRKHGGGGKLNPFAERGLDRFSVVLSELEARRAKILRRVVGSGHAAGLVLVRFAVQSNGGWTPVIVKLPDEPFVKGKGAAKKSPRAAAAAPLPPPASASRAASPPDPASPREGGGGKKAPAAAAKVPARRASFSWGRVRRAWRPSCYLPAAIVLTLVSLAVFGRVFAICLTTVWWYVLPTLAGSGAGGEDARRAGLRRSMEKKKLVSLQSRAKNGQQLGRA